MRSLWTLALVLVALFAWPLTAAADVKLPALFTDHMVLQRDQPIPVWGWAEAGEKVKVSLGDQAAETVADAQGAWRANLPPQAAGGPHVLNVEGDNKLAINDVLVGEVWVCSGQSNMQWTVKQSANGNEAISAGDHPQIRMFTVARKPHVEPQADCQGDWQVASPQTVGNFSAVGYFFGLELQRELDVPIGLINTSWGGTLCEAWTSHDALAGEPDFQPILDRAAAANKDPKQAGNPNRASVLYNGMIAPLVPYGVRGAIWYQGESNVGRAAQYGKLFPAMINDWRKAWGQGDFPFLFVQLAPFRYNRQHPDAALCAELWDSQTKTLALPNTGMAVLTDITTLDNIHPPNKVDVGRRLALWALAKTYGKERVHSGPLYKSMQVEGDKVRLTFDHVGGGLAARDGQPLAEFTIAAADGEFVPAEAVIEGDSVVVHSADVAQPAAVRMGWRDTAQPNLMNKDGLPASPFRTDDRPLQTAGAK